MTRSQALGAALLLSVTVNLLVGGALIGRWYRWGGEPGPPPMHWVARDVDPALHEQLRSHMRRQMTQAQPLREDLRAAMREVRGLSAAETFDRAAMARSLVRLRDAQQAYQAFMHEQLLEFAQSLPVEQRVALLAGALHRGEGRRPGRPRSPPGATSEGAASPDN